MVVFKHHRDGTTTVVLFSTTIKFADAQEFFKKEMERIEKSGAHVRERLNDVEKLIEVAYYQFRQYAHTEKLTARDIQAMARITETLLKFNDELRELSFRAETRPEGY